MVKIYEKVALKFMLMVKMKKTLVFMIFKVYI